MEDFVLHTSSRYGLETRRNRVSCENSIVFFFVIGAEIVLN